MYDQKLRDLGETIERATELHDFDDLVHRARRRVALRRARTSIAVGCVVAAVAFAVVQVGDSDRRTDSAPADRNERGVVWCVDDDSDCADIRGWIAYGRPNARHPQDTGIHAIDPDAPGDPDTQVQLTDESMTPLEWSSDGSKLLVRRWPAPSEDAGALVVLRAEGREIEVLEGAGYGLDASFSPDGSQIAYAWYGSGGIYIVDADGGTPRLLLAPETRAYPGEERRFLGELYNPAFSPDGSHIAYFDGMGDWGHSLRVMRSDGTGVRVLLEGFMRPSHIDDLVWSPDGSRLMFAFAQREGGVWTIGADGSGLVRIVDNGVNPAWSPDGTRISYQERDAGNLRIADATGKDVVEFSFGGSGPWNPLPHR